MVIFGILLVVAGAIITFALDVQVADVDLELVGWIMMAGGAVAVIAGLIRGGSSGLGRRRMVSERHVSADGQHVVEETEID